MMAEKRVDLSVELKVETKVVDSVELKDVK